MAAAMARGRIPPAWLGNLGDIIFVRPDPGDWAGRLVAHATGGPYCHVRIRLSLGEVVEALARGVCRDALVAEPDPSDVAAVGAGLEQERRNHALGWLLMQVGKEYSVLDLVADGVELLLPQRLGSRTPFLVAPSHYDCSELATRFLLLAGYEWLPNRLAMDPQRVSPNALARALGVLKP